MSDTPRTEGYVLNKLPEIVPADWARQLERELAAAKERIRRLEEAGDAMLNAWLMPEDSMEYSDWVCLSSDAKSKWYAAKEAKP